MHVDDGEHQCCPAVVVSLGYVRALMDQSLCCLSLFVKCDRRRRVERNSIPDQLSPTVVNTLLASECAGGVRSLHFKSQRPIEGFSQPNVVQDRSHRENLTVMRSLLALRDLRGKDPRSHDMIKQVRLRPLAGELYGPRNQRRVGARGPVQETRHVY